MISEEEIKRGRPTKYMPEYCEQVIQLGKDGASVAEMALTFGVAVAQLYKWELRYPEFHQAFTQARDYAVAFYWRTARMNLTEKNFQGDLNKFILHGLQRNLNCRISKALNRAQTNTIESKANQFMIEYDEGRIDEQQLREGMSSLGILAKIEENRELKERIATLEAQISNTN